MHTQRQENGVTVSIVDILDDDAAKNYGKSIGRYVTVSFGKLWLGDDSLFDTTAEAISKELKKLAKETAGDCQSVLVAGLGNRFITADALGPLAVKGISVTRHIKTVSPALYDRIGYNCEIAAIAPGVVGQTGIETLELIKGAAEKISPSLIIVIDALASRSVDRLATTVQLSDSPLAPGSGSGNRRQTLSKESLGCPVIVMGAPTVVNSSTLVYDALRKAGIEEIDDALREVLDNGKNFLVSLKDSDIAVSELARLISEAINRTFA